MMFYPVWTAVFAALLIVTAVTSRVPFIQTWLMGRMARWVGLGIPDDLDLLVRTRVAARWLGYGIGGLVGLVIAAGAFLAAGLPIDRLESWTIFVVAATGAAFGGALASVRAEASNATGVRVARLRVVTIGDYVVPVARVLAWIVLPLAVASFIGAVLSLPGDMTRARFVALIVPGIALLVAGFVSLVVFEVTAHRIVRRGQPAVSTDELVWGDALRSVTLGDLLGTPVIGLVLGASTPFVGQTDSDVGAGGFLVAMLMIGVAIVFAIIRRFTFDWYLARLWPGARRRTPAEEEARLAQNRQTQNSQAEVRHT